MKDKIRVTMSENLLADIKALMPMLPANVFGAAPVGKIAELMLEIAHLKEDSDDE